MTKPSTHAVHLALDAAQAFTVQSARAAKSAGLTTIIRYLWSGSKGLTRAETEIISSAGLQIVTIWEGRGDRYESYNVDQANWDATHSVVLARALGIPSGATLYFCACDFDATDQQVQGGITGYFIVLSPLIRAAGFRIGAYGNGAACQYLQDKGLVDNTWVWGVKSSNGTQDYLATNRWSIRQYPTLSEFGLSADPDDIQGDIGSWSLEVAKPAMPVPQPTATTIGDPPKIGSLLSFTMPTASQLQSCLRSAGYANLVVDGLWGPHSAAALQQFYDSQTVAAGAPTTNPQPVPQSS